MFHVHPEVFVGLSFLPVGHEKKLEDIFQLLCSLDSFVCLIESDGLLAVGFVYSFHDLAEVDGAAGFNIFVFCISIRVQFNGINTVINHVLFQIFNLFVPFFTDGGSGFHAVVSTFFYFENSAPQAPLPVP